MSKAGGAKGSGVTVGKEHPSPDKIPHSIPHSHNHSTSPTKESTLHSATMESGNEE